MARKKKILNQNSNFESFIQIILQDTTEWINSLKENNPGSTQRGGPIEDRNDLMENEVRV